MNDPLLCSPPECFPGEPTDAAPGSERKIRILIERAARHESLFHPQDGVRRSKDARPFWVQRLEDHRKGPETALPQLAAPSLPLAKTLEFESAVEAPERAAEEFAARILDEAV